MKRYFLLLLIGMVGLTACAPVTQYIVEARRTAYQHSRDLGVLKMPPGLKTGPMAYVIPKEGRMGPAYPVNLEPPTS